MPASPEAPSCEFATSPSFLCYYSSPRPGHSARPSPSASVASSSSPQGSSSECIPLIFSPMRISSGGKDSGTSCVSSLSALFACVDLMTILTKSCSNWWRSRWRSRTRGRMSSAKIPSRIIWRCSMF